MRKHIIIIIIIISIHLFGSADDYVAEIQSLIDESAYLIANEKFESALKEYNANASLYFIGGQVAIKLDNLDVANQHFIKSIKLDDKNKEYRSAQQKLEELKDLLTNARKTFDSGNIDTGTFKMYGVS